ncbi:MAG: NAD(P)H-dependent oxidoreductase [Bauldia sp.]|nr:NAD(P)H-dependent oxidoreductase [Bauldia sp.]
MTGTPNSDLLKVLILNASLKHAPDPSNTEEVANLILGHMREHAVIDAETVRLADRTIPVGLKHRESDDDEWPDIGEQIKGADVVIFATPIWWGHRSSLMQRVIERMDAFDEDAHAGRSALLNKVAGIVITGSEDGAQAAMAGMMEVLSFMNFLLPPQCCTYWVGEVGLDPKTDAARRRANPAVDAMARATARNLVQAARMVRASPFSET